MSVECKGDDGEYIERDHLDVDFFYPSNRGVTEEFVRIGLMHVRAADAITVRYDFERDGWVIYMDKVKDEGDCFEVVSEGEEVAFIPVWNE